MKQDSLLFSHDPALYHDPVSGDYFLYCTGAKIYRSKDMVKWTKLKYPATAVPEEAKAWTGSDAIWAPDIYKEGDEYRLYCSNSSWGVQQSCIFLAVADKAEGPFTPRGIVHQSSDALSVNAIDAALIKDHETGALYMVYGSFWGGIHLLELDPVTGLKKSDSPVNMAGEGNAGICLARRPQWADGAIEGPYIIYNPDTDYYYLFVSYGSLKSDYNIRVGRSRKVTGPYVDHQGRPLTEDSCADADLGYMVTCGYEFTSGAFMGPGHNSVLRDFDGKWYLTSHIRPRNFFEEVPSTTHIRSMYWTKDGWPVVAPIPYKGENQLLHTESKAASIAAIAGTYERVRLAPTIPQGIQSYVKMVLKEDGTGMLADSIHLTWILTDAGTIQLTYGPCKEELFVLSAANAVLSLTGVDESHTCIWAIKHS